MKNIEQTKYLIILVNSYDFVLPFCKRAILKVREKNWKTIFWKALELNMED